MEAVKIYPELIKWKPNKTGDCSITIRIDYNFKRAGNIQLHQAINPKYWDENERRVRKSHPQQDLLNLVIDNEENKHKTFFLRRQAFHLPVTMEMVKQYINSGTSLDSFYEYAELVIETKRLKDGQPYTEDSKRRYRDEIKRMKLFKPNLSFRDLNAKCLQAYKLWLQNDYRKKDKTKLEPNSIWKAFMFIRMVYNYAIDNDIILGDDNPFRTFDVGSCVTDVTKIKYLEMSEVEALEKVLANPHLQELTCVLGGGSSRCVFQA